MDEPIENKKDDKLGRKGEVQEFAKYLGERDASTNLIASIQAPWGEGKSSFLNMVKEGLDSENSTKFQVIPFNPWQFSGHQDLLQQFFTTFSESEGISSEFRGALASIGSLAKLTSLVPGFEVFGLIEKVLDKGADFATSIPEENIQKLRDHAKSAAKEQSQHYIFLIDELDRLESHEVRSFLQMLKAVADFPNTTYVLAYDAEALGDLLQESGVHNPQGYLEKIIGFPYSLPSISMEDLEQVHTAEIKRILEKQGLEPLDKTRWSIHEVYAALPNLRQCKRHVAHFEFLCRSIGKYVDTTDLAYVSIIQLLDPSLWRTIGEHQSWFWGTSNGGSEPNQGLIDLKKKCLAQGKESVWQIVCIVYEGVVGRSELEGEDILFPMATEINKPIRAASNNSFLVYHTRKPASAWSQSEISLLKQAFKGLGSHQNLYSVLTDYPEQSLIWLRHLVESTKEYEGLDTARFIALLIMGFEENIDEERCQELLTYPDYYKLFLMMGHDTWLAQEILGDSIQLTDQYKQSPLYYALEINALPFLCRTFSDDIELTDSVNKALSLRHEVFWGQIGTFINHPFIHWAFANYISETKGKDTFVSSALMKDVEEEVFWLKKEVLPKVLLFVVTLNAGNSIGSNEYIKLWELVLGQKPDFSMLIQKINKLETRSEATKNSVAWHQPLIMDIVTKEPLN